MYSVFPVLSALHSVLVTVHFCHLTVFWDLQGRQNIREIFSIPPSPPPSVYINSWMQQEQIAILVCFLRIQDGACQLCFLLCNIIYNIYILVFKRISQIFRAANKNSTTDWCYCASWLLSELNHYFITGILSGISTATVVDWNNSCGQEIKQKWNQKHPSQERKSRAAEINFVVFLHYRSTNGN